jgi:hypothetical protein
MRWIRRVLGRDDAAELDQRTLFLVMGLLTGLLAAASLALRAGFGREAVGKNRVAEPSL